MRGSWGAKNSKISYQANTSGTVKNRTIDHTSSILRSHTAICNNSLQADYEKILNGGCSYLPSFICEKTNMEIFNLLKSELDLSKVVNWSKHYKLEDPTMSKTFADVVKKMADHFGIDVLQTRLNFYRNGNDFKPLHHDKHAYADGNEIIREDFTMGASFGSSRNLDMVHESSNLKFTFPQNNGDVFAFDSEINKLFLHGIPKSHNSRCGDRISIIAWGKKRV